MKAQFNASSQSAKKTDSQPAPSTVNRARPRRRAELDRTVQSIGVTTLHDDGPSSSGRSSNNDLLERISPPRSRAGHGLRNDSYMSSLRMLEQIYRQSMKVSCQPNSQGPNQGANQRGDQTIQVGDVSVEVSNTPGAAAVISARKFEPRASTSSSSQEKTRSSQEKTWSSQERTSSRLKQVNQQDGVHEPGKGRPPRQGKGNQQYWNVDDRVLEEIDEEEQGLTPQTTSDEIHIKHVQRGAHMSVLNDVVAQATTVVINFAFPALATNKNLECVRALIKAVQKSGKANTHTHGYALSALSDCGRFDLALQYFEDATRARLDIGSVGASTLLKLCAQQQDIDLAMELFHELSSTTTINRYSYNCIIHLCGVLGRVDEARAIIHLMREDPSPASSPDGFTYAGLAHAMGKARRWELLNGIVRQMEQDKVNPDPEVWCLLIINAARALRPDLALQYFEKCKKGDWPPSQQIYNALMTSFMKVDDLQKVLELYRAMQEEGLAPDEYTFNAVISALSHAGGTPLKVVEDMVGEMQRWGVKINTYLGTSLINAYRRTPEASSNDPEVRKMVYERVHSVLRYLAYHRMANCQTYSGVMVMHASAGDVNVVFDLMKEMGRTGVRTDSKTLQ
eukprot:gene14785-20835_t